MRGKEKSGKQRKPPDKLAQIRDALTGGEKSSKKIVRAFETLMRQEPEPPESGPRRKK